MVARATGMSRTTVRAGIAEIRSQAKAQAKAVLATPSIRRPGGDHKSIKQRHPQLLAALEALVEPAARGEQESPLCWTISSTRVLARTLKEQAHRQPQHSRGLVG
jgi:Rhodopirellula transposase DDE domain